MDSRLLAGAYSKRYKYIEREHIDTLKDDDDSDRIDVLAKARKLSQETNKRRKQLAQKRKQEAAREEKRRQEILNRRHQEQKQATEKYQRCHVGSRRLSPRRRGQSPSRSRVNLEEALRLIRGGSASNGPDEQSREAIQRLYNQQQNGRDPLERSHNRSTRVSSASSRESGQGHNRPLSGRPLDASLRAQLMERSMRNLTSSRSRFEQQLEQHQQLLVEQQQKSLHDFNQAIRQEIDADTKVQGVEGTDADNVPLRSESLSSLDSLEEGNQSSLENSQADHQFHQMTEQQREAYNAQNGDVHGDSTAQNRALAQELGSQERLARPQSAKVSAMKGQRETQPYAYGQTQNQIQGGANVATTLNNSHIIGPIPQGYYTPQAGVPPSSTPVIQGNLSYYSDSLDASQSVAERRVAVGTALRLPQQSPPVSQPVKQPPPALQYDSQLLAHRKFETCPNQKKSGVGPRQFSDNNDAVDNAQQRNNKNSSNPTSEEPTSALTQNEQPNERPKAHIYAWTSPPPEESEQESNFIHTDGQANINSNYSASMVADRVMATNLHPQTSRTISTAATTTWVYQTVNAAHNKEPVYTQSGTVPSSSASHQSSFAAQGSQAEIPKGQGQKPGSVLTSTGTYPATTGLKFVASMPPSYQSHMQSADNRQQSQPHGSHGQNHNQNQVGTGRETGSSTHQNYRGGSVSQGTLGLVNGKLTTIDIGQSQYNHQEKKITVVEDDMDGKKEVRSILKRVKKDPAPKVTEGVTRFNVHDSVEIARKHMKSYEDVKRKKAQKKGVRFADLHYPEEVEEDTDSADSFIDATTAVNKANTKAGSAGDGRSADSGTRTTAQRPRPASARVVSATQKTGESKTKAPRVVSAGPTRTHSASRPKAAAHIIMSGDASTNNQGNESSPAGFSVHKSQLDKKVMLINNNFMSRTPMYSSTASSTAVTMTPVSNAAATVYTVSADKNGTSATHPTSSTLTGDSSGTGYGKTVTYSQSTDQTRGARGKTTVPTLHSTTVLPSHSHFSNANNMYKGVYNENGLRIDRTPTDDEINSLWKNMRTMLDVNDGKSAPQMSTTTNTSNNNDQASRQQVQLSHQYIDGAALGIPNGLGRAVTTYPSAKPTQQAGNNMQAGPAKPGSQNKNGYLQRYSLLQQRRNHTGGIGASAHTNGVVEQTVHPMPLSSTGEPRQTSVSVSYAPRGEEMSESMAGFLAAEQVLQTQGPDIRDSRVMAAVDSAQNQQEMYNSIRQKVAKGGPSALSMEERRLLESLDKLNERLKVVENRPAPSNQMANYPNSTADHQIYVHGSGFRGHQVITSQSFRRNSGGLRPMGRPTTARLLTRPYH